VAGRLIRAVSVAAAAELAAAGVLVGVVGYNAAAPTSVLSPVLAGVTTPLTSIGSGVPALDRRCSSTLGTSRGAPDAIY
jgi:hypothetical protein